MLAGEPVKITIFYFFFYGRIRLLLEWLVRLVGFNWFVLILCGSTWIW